MRILPDRAPEPNIRGNPDPLAAAECVIGGDACCRGDAGGEFPAAHASPPEPGRPAGGYGPGRPSHGGRRRTWYVAPVVGSAYEPAAANPSRA